MCIEIKCSCSLSNLTLYTWTSTQGLPWYWKQSNSKCTEAFLPHKKQNRSQLALFVTKLELSEPPMKSPIQEIKEEILSL